MNDDGTELIPQPHGGALRPFTTGTGAAARRTPVRAVRKVALALLAEGTPEAAGRLLTLMRSDDERVSAVACSQVLDRVLGRPSDMPQVSIDGHGVLDLSHLTPDERSELGRAVATIYRLTGRDLVRQGAKQPE